MLDSNNFGITYDEIKIPYDLKIEDLNVALSINHTYLSDLDITLISPSGKEVALVRNIGGNKSNFVKQRKKFKLDVVQNSNGQAIP